MRLQDYTRAEIEHRTNPHTNATEIEIRMIMHSVEIGRVTVGHYNVYDSSLCWTHNNNPDYGRFEVDRENVSIA